MPMVKAYQEIIDCIASGTQPDTVIRFHPLESVKACVSDLIAREKTDGLSAVEKSEVDVYLQLEHRMRRFKTCT